MYFIEVHFLVLTWYRKKGHKPLPITCNNFRTNFSYLSFVVGLVVLSYRFLMWPWRSIFNVQYLISYISGKKGLIDMKRKTNTLIKHKAPNVALNFGLGHDISLCHVFNQPYVRNRWADCHKMEKEFFEFEASDVVVNFDLCHDLVLDLFHGQILNQPYVRVD